MNLVSKTTFRIRAQYYTPMAKPLGVTVPGSTTSTIPGTASLWVETQTENPLAALAQEISETTLSLLPVKTLRDLVECLRAVGSEKVPKSGRKAELIQRILASPHKDLAVQRFLVDKDVREQQKRERVRMKLFTALRGALRQAGTEILHSLHLPYSVPALPDDKLSEGTHKIGDCPDPDNECLLCHVFGSLSHASLFKNYTPPLVDDPQQKLALPQEVNPVLIRTHARNVHRPDGSTFNFNQQYFAGEFITYLEFTNGLPPPVVLGFLLHCLEWCPNIGAAKAWGAGKLFLRSYALEKVELTYDREWNGATIHLTPQLTITPLKEKLEQALAEYQAWLAQLQTRAPLLEQPSEEVEA